MHWTDAPYRIQDGHSIKALPIVDTFFAVVQNRLSAIKASGHVAPSKRVGDLSQTVGLGLIQAPAKHSFSAVVPQPASQAFEPIAYPAIP